MIIPLIKSKSINKFVNKEYAYPFRVGLYPGLSCMFECSFCGRNYKAKYERSALDRGIDMYKELISDAPKDDKNRFYISGGLEPLTNPKLGEIISTLKKYNFNTSMYTNAYMLTKKYLDKNNEIFDLNSLRVSFYGINSKNTLEVTKKNKAFETVTQNIKSYLIEKEKINSKTSFGLNFVILKNRERDVIELLNLISKINEDINLKKNNSFDFLTLREDFSIDGNRMTSNERKVLSDSLIEIDEMLKNKKYLKDLLIDYGFALEPLKKGITSEKFENIFVEKEDLFSMGVPQSSVAVDLYGDVYLYREAAFLDRPGAKRYIIGNLLEKKTMKKVIEEFIDKERDFEIMDSDRNYLDVWDHISIKLSKQYKNNADYGFSENNGVLNLNIISKILNYNHEVHFAKKK